MNLEKTIINKGKQFYSDRENDLNGRYRSWEYCYETFHKAHEDGHIDYDYLSLQLAFYLASWGMYRGSSFLLQKDYKVHIPAIIELMKKDYNSLWSISVKDFLKADNQVLFVQLVKNLKNIYLTIKKETKGFENSIDVSNTLITKVLMGTLGCTPAYDTYFIDALKRCKFKHSQFSVKSMIELSNFYIQYYEEFEKSRKMMKFGSLRYPQMKYIDGCLWQFGKEL